VVPVPPARDKILDGGNPATHKELGFHKFRHRNGRS
jgi:hypothetical protein